ncbi:serine hydrolase domain-containing protein [Pseudalkalibacillus caeni]|uniref:Serine hydrolase n=1 Tax=Exobacillus caeni TaxID=2574798 RepID=A0A5R9F0M2_9BACL|nr:serine hydrolase [Pseudalkalibacillus caeni]TLS35960.1 serine hydrolase [Pseudalkalibacillus caeni]
MIKNNIGLMTIAILYISFSIMHAFIPEYFTTTYFLRGALWGEADIEDYKRFPSRGLAAAKENTFHFKKNINEKLVHSASEKITYFASGKPSKITNLESFLTDNETTAFLIIKNDTILYEKYFNGYSRNSVNTSFSMAKSFLSALIGKAVEEGYINSLDDPITNYLPELKEKNMQAITIRHLLTMSSGLSYSDGFLLFGDGAKTYYPPDLRKIALQETFIKEGPGEHFLYNNYNPLLLGLILERATRQPVSAYLENKIWRLLGMEFEGSWSIDSKDSGFEKMESGINARAIDFAKFGRLFLNKGNWNGKQVLSESWVTESTSPLPVIPSGYYENTKDWALFSNKKGYYSHMWWGYERKNGEHDFFAMGNFGQFIYVCPSKNLIIVRNGKDYGKVDAWPEIFYEMANNL